jgi:hypothetical protein
MGSEGAPGADELLSCFGEFHISKLDKVIEFSKFIESMVVY